MDKKYFQKVAKQYHLELTDNLLEKFAQFQNMLLSWNQKMNLTAITDEKEIIDKHFIDSLLLTCVLGETKGKKAVDIGAGAGFPSIPVALYDEKLQWIGLDSLQKRIGFINEVIQTLCICNYKAVHERAQEAGQNSHLRETFDYGTARAVAKLSVLAELGLPLVKKGGSFFALKGGTPEQEIEDAANAIYLLGGHIQRIHSFELPDSSRRTIIEIKKIQTTPAKYPRLRVNTAKKPL